MASKRTPLLSTFMHILTLVALAALVFMVFYTYAYGPAGGSFSLRSIHYTFKALHQQGSVFYPLMGFALATWILRPSPRTSSAGR
jgi:hypothetical protein